MDASPRDQMTARQYGTAVLIVAALGIVFFLVDAWRSPSEPFMARYRDVAFMLALAALAGSLRLGSGPRARYLLLVAWGLLAFAVAGLVSAIRSRS